VNRAEKRSGSMTDGRDELRVVFDFVLRPVGDVLMVTRIDRPARSIDDMQNVIGTVPAPGANLKAMEQPIDTSTAAVFWPGGGAARSCLGGIADRKAATVHA
jgi:DNA invertase Pin-like site-specific DNA recombinase